MSLNLYVDLLNIVLDQFNVDLLVLIWRDSLVLNKTSLKELNSLILSKLPLLRKHFGMEEKEKDSFPEFVRDYDEHVYAQCDETPTGCLLFFAYEGDLRSVKKAIEKGAVDLDNALYEAARGGNRKIVDYLLENYDLDLREGLEGAAHGGHKDIVDYFLTQSSSDLPVEENKDIDLNIALRGAAKGSHVELVKYLIKKGANNWNMGLVGAAFGGSFELVEFFITQPPSGRRIGDQDTSNVETAVRVAASQDHLELVKYFLSRYKKFVSDNNILGDLLYIVSTLGHLDIVKFLVDHGAIVTYDDMYDIALKGHSEVIFYLLEHGMEAAYNVVQGAAKAGNEKLVAELMHWFSSHNGDLLQSAEYGLQGAVEGGHLELVKDFLEKVDDVSGDILYTAIGKGRLDITRAILEKLSTIFEWGIDLEEELSTVARTDNMEMAELLLEFGGSPQFLLGEARRYKNKKMEELALSFSISHGSR